MLIKQDNHMPLFSVLIANYNNGKYLMDAIKSVYQQTYTYWEIILVDDGSTDESTQIYRKLEKDYRVHIYFNDTNYGCGYTKHRCVELASGNFCGFLDPDDSLMPNAIQRMVDIHCKYPNVSIIYSKAHLCDTEFNVLSDVVLPDFENGRTYFDNRNSGSMCFSSFKKHFYDKTDGINSELKAGVDQDLYFKLEEVGEIYVLNEFTYYYVIKGHTQAISTNFSNYASLWYWNLKVRQDACHRRGIPEEILISDFSRILSNYAQILFDECNDNLIESACKVRMQKAVEQKEREIRSSMAYRIGKSMLRPILFVKSLLFGSKNNSAK